MAIISKVKMPGMANAYDIGVDWENVKDKPDVGSIDVGVTNEVLNIDTNDNIAIVTNENNNDLYNYDFDIIFTLNETEPEKTPINEYDLSDCVGTLNKSVSDIQQLYNGGYIKLIVKRSNGQIINSYPVIPTFGSCGGTTCSLASQEPYKTTYYFSTTYYGGALTSNCTRYFYQFRGISGPFQIKSYKFITNADSGEQLIEK